MIQIEGLKKSYGAIKAVQDVSFSVAKGEILGFLGPNGAGKSTTMKMINGFVSPDEGRILVGDKDVAIEPIEVRKQIGYMPENAPLYDDLFVYEFLNYIGELRGLNGESLNNALSRVVSLCSLEKVLSQIIGTLSKGFKRRVSLAQALIHDPPILILDEPTDGLDPNQKHDVRQLIKKLSAEKAIVLSTHILEEVDAICTRAVIISDGQILFDGTPQSLAAKSESGKMDDVFRAMTTQQIVPGVSL